MKATNKKLKSVITFICTLVVIAAISALAYIDCTVVGKGQTTNVVAQDESQNTKEPAASPSADEKAQVTASPSADENTQVTASPSADENAQVTATPSADEKAQVTATPSVSEEADKQAEEKTGLLKKLNAYLNKHTIKLGLDLRGGVNIVYEPKLKEGQTVTDEDIAAARTMIQKRLDAKGYTEAEVSLEGKNRIRVDIPGVADPQKAVDEIGAAGLLRFLDQQGNEIVTGTDVDKAAVMQDPQTGKYVVSVEMNDTGKKKFSDFTQNNIGNPVIIMLDDTLLSMATIQSHIADGKGSISGDFTLDSAKDLANGINAGALPFALNAASANGIGAKLGINALSTSILAGIIGFVIILLFMLIAFRLCGVAADIALTLYVGLMILVLSAMEATLTLPGIAGILLSIGMAVDANIIIFVRIKEELEAGRSVRAALDAAFDKAFKAILDGNVTTLIAAGVLYLFGTGLIKSFATTLGVGILVSMFTALVVTRFILKLFAGMDLRKASLYARLKKQSEEA